MLRRYVRGQSFYVTVPLEYIEIGIPQYLQPIFRIHKGTIVMSVPTLIVFPVIVVAAASTSWLDLELGFMA